MIDVKISDFFTLVCFDYKTIWQRIRCDSSYILCLILSVSSSHFEELTILLNAILGLFFQKTDIKNFL